MHNRASANAAIAQIARPTATVIAVTSNAFAIALANGLYQMPMMFWVITWVGTSARMLRGLRYRKMSSEGRSALIAAQ